MSNFTVMGIAIRARWLGFAELDAKCRLLDWGMTYYQKKSPDGLKSAKHRLESLLARRNPTYIVLVRPDLRANERVLVVKSMMRYLSAAASSQSTLIIAFRREDIRAAFADCHAETKEEIASAIARVFPELRWKLPPMRRIWTKEDYRMALFDAVSGAIAYHRKQFGCNELCRNQNKSS